MSDILLSFDHISYSYHSVYGETLAIDDLSFRVNEGEFLAVVGFCPLSQV